MMRAGYQKQGPLMAAFGGCWHASRATGPRTDYSLADSLLAHFALLGAFFTPCSP